MILKEFSRQTSRKNYECVSCKSKILVGSEYMRYYAWKNPTATTLHIECFYRELAHELGELDANLLLESGLIKGTQIYKIVFHADTDMDYTTKEVRNKIL